MRFVLTRFAAAIWLEDMTLIRLRLYLVLYVVVVVGVVLWCCSSLRQISRHSTDSIR